MKAIMESFVKVTEKYDNSKYSRSGLYHNIDDSGIHELLFVYKEQNVIMMVLGGEDMVKGFEVRYEDALDYLNIDLTEEVKGDERPLIEVIPEEKMVREDFMLKVLGMVKNGEKYKEVL